MFSFSLSCIWNYLTRTRVRKMHYQVEQTEKIKTERAKWWSCFPLWFCTKKINNSVPLTAYLFRTNCSTDARAQEGSSPCLITPLNLLSCDCHHQQQNHSGRGIENPALVARGAKGFPHAGCLCRAAKLPVYNRTDSHIHCWDGECRMPMDQKYPNWNIQLQINTHTHPSSQCSVCYISIFRWASEYRQAQIQPGFSALHPTCTESLWAASASFR